MKTTMFKTKTFWRQMGTASVLGALVAPACTQRIATGGPTSDDGGAPVDVDDGDDDGGDGDEVVDVDKNDPTCEDFTPTRKRTLKPDGEVHEAAVALLAAMTLEEKIAILKGGPPCPNWDCDFDGTGVPSQGVRDFPMRDGPRGVHTHDGTLATSFAVAMARAASFDLSLEHEVGDVQGIEMKALQYDLALAPTINTLRHPAWARAQETYGEDPVLLGEMGAAYTNGMQKHVPACPKHFAGNNTDENRGEMIAQMDEQTLRENYTRAFKITIEKADPGCIMAAYNGVNGFTATENEHLLTTILRKDWGWEGFVVSDWWATKSNGPASLNAGLDLEMPDDAAFRTLSSDVTSGAVTGQRIEEAATRILNVRGRFGQLEPGYPSGASNTKIVETPYHLDVARRTAEDGAVLLENDGILPISPEVSSIIVMGPDAHLPVAQTNTPGVVHGMGDRGSSNTNPPYAISYVMGLTARAGAGVQVTSSEVVADAAGKDLVIIPVTMQHEDEGEAFGGGGDRDNLNFYQNHPEHWHSKFGQTPSAFIQAVAAVNPNVVVLIAMGSAVVMEDWGGSARAIVQTFYPGQEAGNAVARLLYGDKNFSAKLPYTVATDEGHYPYFGNKDPGPTYEYLHGYRKFEAEGIKPRYWFGFGRSYTTYEYSDLEILCDSVSAEGRLNARVTVKNTGAVAGREIVQAYVGYPNTKVRRPRKELKAFAKTELLEPGEEEVIQFQIPVRDLAFYDEAKGWTLETGIEHELIVAASANPDPASEPNLLKAVFTPN